CVSGDSCVIVVSGAAVVRAGVEVVPPPITSVAGVFFFKQKTAYEIVTATPHVFAERTEAREDDKIFKPGMVTMAEPNPITADGLFGIFLGHTFIVTRDGHEVVDKFPLELVVAGTGTKRRLQIAPTCMRTSGLRHSDGMTKQYRKQQGEPPMPTLCSQAMIAAAFLFGALSVTPTFAQTCTGPQRKINVGVAVAPPNVVHTAPYIAKALG